MRSEIMRLVHTRAHSVGLAVKFWPEILFAFASILVEFVHNQATDIVPIACKAAALAGVPSVCVSNFRYTSPIFFLLHQISLELRLSQT